MSGLETRERVRQCPAYKPVLVVIVTTSDQVADRQWAYGLKVNGFVTKPPTIKEYNEVVHQLRRASRNVCA